MGSRFYTILLLACSFWGVAQSETLFEKANALYNQDDFTEAVEVYEEILNSGQHSAAVYYNLGNAHYKLNNIAPSIYYYEKALMLKPGDADIKNNLAFAQNMTIDAIEPMPKTGFSRIFDGLVGRLTYEGWGVTSIVGMSLFVLLFLVYYFASSSTVKRVAFIASFIALLIALVAVAFAFRQQSNQLNDQPAIVFAEKSSVRSGPKLSDEEVFILHEGTKVQILDEFDQWNKIRIADGKIGWLPSTDIKSLK